MKYIMYRLKFPVGIHLGGQALEESRYTIFADTLFSALYIEALKQCNDVAAKFLHKIQNNEILLSDAFPYIGQDNYLPKPLLRVEVPEQEGNSVIKKAFKKLAYIPVNQMSTYLQGDFDAEREEKRFTEELGHSALKTSVAITGKPETEPYHVGIYYFNKNSGLYFIVALQNDEDEDMIYDLVDSLSFSGIGGKRSSGLGRFEIKECMELDSNCFEQHSNTYMSLSIGLPKENELEKCMDCAQYQLQKRSGFIFSSNYAPEQRKKKDMFMFSSGSCFPAKFEGDIYDVSGEGNHPVYRYAKPIFWSLERG